MSPIDIPHLERGVVRVFSVSRPIPDMARNIAAHGKAAVASELLNHKVAEQDAELFALSDLSGVGIASYLADGYGIPSSALKDDLARLESLDGYVLLLHSSVAREEAKQIRPTSDLTLISTLEEPRESRATAPLQSDAAQLNTDTPARAAAPVRSRIGSLLGVAMLLVVVVAVWLVLT